MPPGTATGSEFLTCVKDPSGISTMFLISAGDTKQADKRRCVGPVCSRQRKKKPQWTFKNRNGNERTKALSVEPRLVYTYVHSEVGAAIVSQLSLTFTMRWRIIGALQKT